MGNKFKRLLSLLLIFSLLLPGLALGEGLSTQPDLSISYGNINIRKGAKANLLKNINKSKSNIDISNLSKELKDKGEKELRVIVELEDKPLLETAMARGVKVSELSPNLKVKEEKRILNSQSTVRQHMSSMGIEGDYLGNYTSVLNGFAMLVDSDDIDRIKSIRGVKSVEISNEYERPDPGLGVDMDSSHEMIGSQESWNTGYDGEGMVVAVLDTGADPNHKDFVISEGKKLALSKDKVDRLVKDNGLEGVYFNEKIPYGYNYYDRSSTVIYDDGDSQHGMHVSGTVAANGDPSKGGVKGVAPEAQILSMKVFSNDISYATTFTDIYLEAIDDAISLGADSLNMSLGSPAGIHVESSIEHEALSRAENAGIINTISSGNSRNIGYGASIFYDNFAILEHNPDMGVVGSPSISPAALTVASADNIKIRSRYMTTNPIIAGREKMILNESGNTKFSSLSNESGYEYISVGIGSQEDFANIGEEVKGKVALVKRGNPFKETVENAEEAGAIACIVYNHEEGGEDLVNMQGSDDTKIPFAFTTYSNGQVLLENIGKIKLVFPSEEGLLDNVSGGLMSDFSSWGVGPDLTLKPEITGPGGQIVSTQNDDKYGTMSGTSMSSPHLAGGSVLVKDFINKSPDFKGLSNKEKSLLTRNLLMNTASPVKQRSGVAYSPRVQGAGMMQLDSATKNKVSLLDRSNNPSKGRAKVEFGEVKGDRLDFDLELRNYGSENLDYRVKGLVLDQLIVDGKYSEEFKIAREEDDIARVQLAGKERKNLSFSLNIDGIKSEKFVDGFIELEEISGRGENLVVPFVGFKGDWSKPRVIDTIDPSVLLGDNVKPEMIDKEGEESQYKFSAFVNEVAAKDSPEDVNTLVMSPSTLYYSLLENDSQSSSIVPYISQLRNSKYIDYLIVDENGKVLRRLGRDSYPRKAHSMNRGTPPVRVADEGRWDGKIGSGFAKDGKYIYRMESSLIYDNKKQQDDFDLIVDSTPPILHKLDGDKYFESLDDSKIKVKVSDNIKKGLTIDQVSRLKGIALFNTSTSDVELVELNDDRLEVKPLDSNRDLYEVIIDLKDYIGEGDIDLFIAPIDKAGNVSDQGIFIDDRKDKGHILLEAPGFLEVLGSEDQEVRESGLLDVRVKGIVYGWNKNGEKNTIDSLTVNGERAEVEFIPYHEVKLDGKTINYKGPVYAFDHKLKLSSGYQAINIVAKSRKDSMNEARELSISRYVFVDLLKPVLKTKIVDVTDSMASIDIHGSDNLSSLSISRNGSLLIDTGDVSSKLKDPSELRYSDKVELERGLNEIKYTIKDGFYKVDRVVRILNNDNLKLNLDKLLPVMTRADDLDRDNLKDKDLRELEGIENSIKDLLKGKILSQNQLDDLTRRLDSTVSSLEKLPNIGSLVKELDRANKIDLKEYTDETTDRLKEAIIRAELILKKEGLSQEEVDRARRDIEIAIDMLRSPDQEEGSGLIPEMAKPGSIGYRKAYIKGYEDGSLRPEDPVSREELATMFYKAMEMTGTGKHNFKDITDDRWSNRYIGKLYLDGVIQGDRGNFRPADSMTRGEFATMLANYLNLKDSYMKVFGDIEGHWAEASINAVAKEGYIQGYSGGEFRPDGKITRAETVTILNRVLGIKLDSSSLPGNINRFVDLDSRDWYYGDMLIASLDHYYTIKNTSYNWVNKK